MGCSESKSDRTRLFTPAVYYSRDEHRIPKDKLLKKLATDLDRGLTTFEANQRQSLRQEKNISTNPKWKKYLDKKMPVTCKVLRDGFTNIISPSELAIGDIILLSPGLVPADIILIQGEGKVLRNTFNGDRIMSDFNANSLPTIEVLETPNAILFGSEILSGYGKGVVIEIGAKRAFEYICVNSFEKPPKEKKRRISGSNNGSN